MILGDTEDHLSYFTLFCRKHDVDVDLSCASCVNKQMKVSAHAGK